MKNGTPNHPKVLMLVAELGVPRYAGVGILEALWHLTAATKPDGAIGELSDDEIAVGIGWPAKKSATLVDALVKARWLDRNDVHRLVIHDWADHCEDAVHCRLARAGRRFADGQIPKMNRLPAYERKRLLDQFGEQAGDSHNSSAGNGSASDGNGSASARQALGKRSASGRRARSHPLPSPVCVPRRTGTHTHPKYCAIHRRMKK